MAEKVNIEDGNEGISRWVPESERVSILRFSATQKNFHNFFLLDSSAFQSETMANNE